MSKTYHQDVMDKHSRHFTTFPSPCGIYECLRIHAGLSNAPPAFQRFMKECLVGLRESVCILYLDDFPCYGKTLDEHLERLRNSGVKRTTEKCVFFKREIKHLGKVISENGYRDSTVNTETSRTLKNNWRLNKTVRILEIL